MADDIETRLQTLRSKQQDAQRRHAQAEAKLDNVRAQKTSLLNGLKEQGFSDTTAAQKRVKELSTETEAILSQIEEQVSSL
jgi:hypothetical protein